METAIILADGIKQIMFTPENDSEKAALELITPLDDISLEMKRGTLYDQHPDCAIGYVIQKSKAI